MFRNSKMKVCGIRTHPPRRRLWWKMSVPKFSPLITTLSNVVKQDTLFDDEDCAWAVPRRRKLRGPKYPTKSQKFINRSKSSPIVVELTVRLAIVWTSAEADFWPSHSYWTLRIALGYETGVSMESTLIIDVSIYIAQDGKRIHTRNKI